MARLRAESLAWLVSAVATWVTATTSARADTPSLWREEWPKFRAMEAGVTVAASLQVTSVLFLYGPPKRNWEGGVLFDDAVRDGLRLSSRDSRKTAARVSDALYYTMLAYPMLDAPLVGWARADGTLAVQTLAMNLESFSVAGAIALSAEKLGRARPMTAECERDSRYDEKCGDDENLNSSFLSGHGAIAFAGAGLTCAHHSNVPLYGGGAPDALACAAGLLAATTSSVLRVMSDNHYATDVLLGTAVGLPSGYLLPVLLHYRRGARRAAYLLPVVESRSVAFVVAPTLRADGLGTQMVGVF